MEGMKGERLPKCVLRWSSQEEEEEEERARKWGSRIMEGGDLEGRVLTVHKRETHEEMRPRRIRRRWRSSVLLRLYWCITPSGIIDFLGIMFGALVLFFFRVFRTLAPLRHIQCPFCTEERQGKGEKRSVRMIGFTRHWCNGASLPDALPSLRSVLSVS
jgi:hypothetical protein